MNSHLRIGSKIKQMIYLPSSQVINGEKVNNAWVEKWRSYNFTGKVGIPEDVFNLSPSSKIQNTVSLSSELEKIQLWDWYPMFLPHFLRQKRAKKDKNVQTFYMDVFV